MRLAQARFGGHCGLASPASSSAFAGLAAGVAPTRAVRAVRRRSSAWARVPSGARRHAVAFRSRGFAASPWAVAPTRAIRAESRANIRAVRHWVAGARVQSGSRSRPRACSDPALRALGGDGVDLGHDARPTVAPRWLLLGELAASPTSPWPSPPTPTIAARRGLARRFGFRIKRKSGTPGSDFRTAVIQGHYWLRWTSFSTIENTASSRQTSNEVVEC
jgi:hypothetical protein